MKTRHLFKLVGTATLALLLAGCGSSKSEDKIITVAASPTPHAQILKVAGEELKKDGYTLKVKEFTDYVQPNIVVDEGKYDANYFQHKPYLDNFNKEKNTKLVSVAKIHYEPFGIYAGTKKSLNDLKDGDEIAIPNDATNEARALLLLADNGVITLKDSKDIKATVKDITSNPKNIKFRELEAAQVSRARPDVALVVLNGNYALDAGLDVKKDAIAFEKTDSTAASTYANIIAVKKGNEKTAKTKALVKALKSAKVQKYINDTFKGAVVPYTE